MFIIFFCVALITFILMHAVPGGPFDSDKNLPKETIEKMEAKYHLNDPLPKQFFDYLSDIFIPEFSSEPPSGLVEDDALVEFKIGNTYVSWLNFGPSYSQRTRSVNGIFKDNLPVSIQLGVLAFIIAVMIGFVSGIIAALHQNSFLDYVSMSIAIIGVSVPVIISGPVLIWIFGVEKKILPPTGWSTARPFKFFFLPADWSWSGFWQYTILPSFALGIGSAAQIARLLRASMLQVMREDYVRTARSKGATERTVILKHVLKNSLIPVLTIFGPLFATLITGTFVTETVFGIPGMGKYFVNSINNRDYPVILGTILLYAMLLVLCNIIVDLLYAAIDPRIRYD